MANAQKVSIIKKIKCIPGCVFANKHKVFDASNVYLSTSYDVAEGTIYGLGKDYKKQMEFIRKCNTPIFLTSDKPFLEVQNGCSDIWGRPNVIVSNGGAFVKDSMGHVLHDQRIPKEAVDAIVEVLNATEQGQEVLKSGMLSINTLSEKVSAYPLGETLLGKIKRRIAFRGKGNIDLKKFEKASYDAYNLTFNIFEKHPPWHETVEVKDPKKIKKLKIPTIGIIFGWNKNMHEIDLPDWRLNLRNPFKKQKIYEKDLKNQQNVAYEFVETLLNQPPEVKQKYLDYVDITLNNWGLSIVPKGCSKFLGVQKYVEGKGLDPEKVMYHGDNVSDFCKPVSLREIDNEREETFFIDRNNRRVAYEKYDQEAFDKTFSKLSEANIKDVNDFVDRSCTYFLSTNMSYGAKVLKDKLKDFETQKNNNAVMDLKNNRGDFEKDAHQYRLEKEKRILEQKFATSTKYGTSLEEQKRKTKDMEEAMNKLEEEYQKKLDEKIAVINDPEKTNIPQDQQFKISNINGSGNILASHLKVFSDLTRNRENSESRTRPRMAM